ncbi:hypothetical protein FHG87_013949 [Trinorchestia longiramus]|nr:hypothetical protein FHG87_013949 [Trinorchestia longiramus]
MKSPHPTPILKKTARTSTSKRLSVTFSQKNEDDDSSSGKDATETPPSEASLSTGTDISDGLRLSAYGLCYEPTKASLPNLSKLHPSVKLTTLKECKRPEISNPQVDDHVLILGDVVHSQCLKKELETNSLCDVRVTLAAVPTIENVSRCSFILIILPLEVIGSCHQVSETLRQLGGLCADILLRCAVVAVTSSHGRDQHVTELLNLHTLLLQYKLSYYVWSDVTPGSWPSILERLVMEITSCRSGPASGSGNAPRHCVVSRAVLSSLLWPRDPSSGFLQDYLDVTAYRRNLDV